MVNFGQGGTVGLTDIPGAMAELAGAVGGMGKMRHDKKQGDESHAKALELAALRIKELEDQLAAAPAERALRERVADAGIANAKDDNAIRRKALDDAAAARAAALARGDKVDADKLARANARAAALAKVYGILGGGALPTSNPGGADPAAVQGPVLPAPASQGQIILGETPVKVYDANDVNLYGQGPGAAHAPQATGGGAVDAARANRYFPQAPMQGPMAPPMQGPVREGYDGPDPEPDDDFDDETKAHLSESQNIFAALAPLMGDLDPEDQRVVAGMLKDRRAKGLADARRNFTKKFVSDMVKGGSIDDAHAQQAMQVLDAKDPESGEYLADPEDVLKGLKDVEKASREQAIDDRMRMNATSDAENLISNLPALGVHLSRAQQYEIEQLREELQRPTTPTKRALAAADKIREKVFGWANKGEGSGSGGAKAWHENPAVVAILKDTTNGTAQSRLAEAMAMARGLGLEGVPGDAAAAPAAGGAPAGQPAQGAPPAPREDVSVRVALKNELGREPTDVELAERLRALESGRGQPAPLYGSQEEQIRATIGEPPSMYPPLPASTSGARRDPRGDPRFQKPSLRDIAVAAGVKLE